MWPNGLDLYHIKQQIYQWILLLPSSSIWPCSIWTCWHEALRQTDCHWRLSWNDCWDMEQLPKQSAYRWMILQRHCWVIWYPRYPYRWWLHKSKATMQPESTSVHVCALVNRLGKSTTVVDQFGRCFADTDQKNDPFCLIFPAGEAHRSVIDDISMHYRLVKLAYSMASAIAETTRLQPMRYPVSHVVTKTFQLASNCHITGSREPLSTTTFKSSVCRSRVVETDIHWNWLQVSI